jgi:hypothetical protein
VRSACYSLHPSTSNPKNAIAATAAETDTQVLTPVERSALSEELPRERTAKLTTTLRGKDLLRELAAWQEREAQLHSCIRFIFRNDDLEA